jgi:hypothetical protein
MSWQPGDLLSNLRVGLNLQRVESFLDANGKPLAVGDKVKFVDPDDPLYDPLVPSIGVVTSIGSRFLRGNYVAIMLIFSPFEGMIVKRSPNQVSKVS